MTARYCCDGDCRQGQDCPLRNDTTRRYPRTLAEAFPAERAHAVTRTPRAPWWVRLARAVWRGRF